MRKWLKEIMEAKKMTQASLAKLVGVDVTSVGKYISGERRPSVETAKRIAEMLGFEWTRFFEDGGGTYDEMGGVNK